MLKKLAACITVLQRPRATMCCDLVITIELTIADNWMTVNIIGKNNRFPLLDILGYLKNTDKNPSLAK